MTEAIYMGSISGAVAAIFAMLDRLWRWREILAFRRRLKEQCPPRGEE